MTDNEMQVYITYEKDGYGGSQVDKVFAEEPTAIDYIVKMKFGSNEFYANQTRTENEKLALEHIEQHPVVYGGTMGNRRNI